MGRVTLALWCRDSRVLFGDATVLTTFEFMVPDELRASDICISIRARDVCVPGRIVGHQGIESFIKTCVSEIYGVTVDAIAIRVKVLKYLFDNNLLPSGLIVPVYNSIISRSAELELARTIHRNGTVVD